jgi:uncharacterized membrane protein
MVFGSIAWVLFLGAIVYFAVSLSGGRRASSDAPAGSALDIAKRRYASGEISEEEFQRIKGHIGG